MTINRNGNVGIENKLSVSGEADFSGHVRIGTINPNSTSVKLDVDGGSGDGVRGISTNGNGVIALSGDGPGLTAGSSNGNLIEGRSLGLRFRVANNGQVRSDVGFTTPAADFAEMLPAETGLEAGDVLVIGRDGKLVPSTRPRQTRVAGVYSTKPGFVGGQAIEGAEVNKIPLAVVGIVPVKVTTENGPIRPGDLLTSSSTPGHAMRAGARPVIGTVIGKVLRGLQTGTGVIQMLAILQ